MMTPFVSQRLTENGMNPTASTLAQLQSFWHDLEQMHADAVRALTHPTTSSKSGLRTAASFRARSQRSPNLAAEPDFQQVRPHGDDLLSMSIADLAQAIRAAVVSPVEVTERLFSHIHRCDQHLNAFISVRRERALAEARIAENEILRGTYRGPLHGVPVALKDNIFLAGEVSTSGSEIHRNFVSETDADVVKALRIAGAIICGKSNMHEYAWGATNNNPHYGAVRNPWNKDLIAGGSSGGSAVAVATDMAYAALGTDTAGSIRMPAASCGVVGLKPTRGLVSDRGTFPLAPSFDHMGTLTKTVTDAALLLEALVATPVQTPTGDVGGLRIGIANFFFDDVDGRILSTIHQHIDGLVAVGATKWRVDIPLLRHALWARLTIALPESVALHRQNLVANPAAFGTDVLFLAQLGMLFSDEDRQDARRLANALSAQMDATLADVDVLITPTLPVLPNRLGSQDLELNGRSVDGIRHFPRFTGVSNVTGHPSISVPAGLVDGLPVGLQIIGRHHDEFTVLTVAKAVEQATGILSR